MTCGNQYNRKKKYDAKEEFSFSKVILVEGVEDAAFLRKLAKYKGLNFDIRVNEDIGGIAGIAGFRKSFGACEVIRGFTNVSDVILVGDNDNDAIKSFNEIKAQLDDAKKSDELDRKWATPQQVAIKEEGDPNVAIWMWPDEKQVGCLETLLWNVIKSEYPNHSNCIEKAYKCVGVERDNLNYRYKGFVRCFLLFVEKKPIVSLAKMWADYPNLIPIDHEEFDPICKFLESI